MRRSRTARLPDELRAVVVRRVRQWQDLDDAERVRLEHLTARILRKRWEPANGFAVDDDMRATVAAHAALLHLAHDGEPFRNVTAIVIHPTTMVLRGERPGPFPGVMTDAPIEALGHTTASGPVFIAWDAVERDLAAPGRGSNVILHEFAHKIDALNGTLDGTPRLADAAQLREWVAVCTTELHRLRQRGWDPVLRSYAATNPSEFFAVATEAFFDQPVELLAHKPELYGVLARFYAQDPAARVTAAPSPANLQPDETRTDWPRGSSSAPTAAW